MAAQPHQTGFAFFAAVEEATRYGGPQGAARKSESFNAAAAHVSVLLGDAVAAFQRRSYGTCAFLSITAIEETAKAEMLGFRVEPPSDGKKRGRDPLRSHLKKHLIGVRPTTFMGRLPNLLGNKVCARLQHEAEDGDLVTLREQALYVHADENGVTTPATAITRDRAREVLLLALEVADDVLVGWTDASNQLGEGFEVCISQVATAFSSAQE
jgi:AbiV family abortive infection protein